MQPIINAQQAFIKIAGFAKHNPGVNLPNTEAEYNEYADALMEVTRVSMTNKK